MLGKLFKKLCAIDIAPTVYEPSYIVMCKSDEWTAIYLDGKLEVQGPLIEPETVINMMRKIGKGGFVLDIIEDVFEMGNRGTYPDYLDELYNIDYNDPHYASF
jgi:hypothetical protein